MSKQIRRARTAKTLRLVNASQQSVTYGTAPFSGSARDVMEYQAQVELCDSEEQVPEWLTTEEAANYLRIPVGTLRNWTSNGRVPYRKFGKLNRYKKDELRDLLNRNRRGGSYEY